MPVPEIRRNLEDFAVPAESAGEKAAPCPCGIVGIRGGFDRPVVRQANEPPGTVVETRMHGGIMISWLEFPIKINIYAFSHYFLLTQSIWFIFSVKS